MTKQEFLTFCKHMTSYNIETLQQYTDEIAAFDPELAEKMRENTRTALVVVEHVRARLEKKP